MIPLEDSLLVSWLLQVFITIQQAVYFICYSVSLHRSISSKKVGIFGTFCSLLYSWCCPHGGRGSIKFVEQTCRQIFSYVCHVYLFLMSSAMQNLFIYTSFESFPLLYIFKGSPFAASTFAASRTVLLT